MKPPWGSLRFWRKYERAQSNMIRFRRRGRRRRVMKWVRETRRLGARLFREMDRDAGPSA